MAHCIDLLHLWPWRNYVMREKNPLKNLVTTNKHDGEKSKRKTERNKDIDMVIM